MTTKKEIISTLDNILTGQREQSYGKPEDNFKRIADLWNIYLCNRAEAVPLDPKEVAIMMALMKIARLQGPSPTLDSWVDLAGYAICGGSMFEE